MKNVAEKLAGFIGKIFASKMFIMVFFTFCYACSAINPDILKNPAYFCQYIAYAILATVMQTIDSKNQDKKNAEYEHRIAELEKQIRKGRYKI